VLLCRVRDESENEAIVLIRAIGIRYEYRFAAELSGWKRMQDPRTALDIVARDGFEDAHAFDLVRACNVERHIALSMAPGDQSLIDARELAATVVQCFVFDFAGIEFDSEPVQFHTAI
jgi:hypothetical protein